MMAKQSFATRLKGYDIKGTTTFVIVPAKIMRAFAPRKRVPVKASVNGHLYRTTIVDMGDGPCLGVNKSVREAVGIKRNDPIRVTLELDTEERTVEVPRDLAKALGKKLGAAFDALSYSHRKEFVLVVLDAKKPETRARRIRRVKEEVAERAQARKRR